jgi:hypothetical protein
MVQRKMFLPLFSLLFFLLCICTGCFTVTVKNYPPYRPFVHQTNIHVKGSMGVDEQKELEAQLAQQLHDSIRVRSVSKAIGWDNAILGIFPRFFYEVQNNPTAYDSIHASQSVQFMRTLLATLGYYRDSIHYTAKVADKDGGAQKRTTVDFYVYPGTVTKIDSIAYRLNADTATASPQLKQALDTIEKLTLDVEPQSVIKRGDPFSRYKLSQERDRLADVYRNNGYMRFSEEELLIVWDTVGVELLRPTIDLAEQAALLQALSRRRANPVADIEFRLRENPDSSRSTRYYVGRVNIYPDYTTDTVQNFRFSDTVEGYVIRYNEPLFKRRSFRITFS